MFESRTTSSYRSAAVSAASPSSSTSSHLRRRRIWSNNHNRSRNRDRDLSPDIYHTSLSFESNRVSISASSLLSNNEQHDQDQKDRSPMMELLHKLLLRCLTVSRRKRRKNRQRLYGQNTKKMKNRFTEYQIIDRGNDINASSPSTTLTASASASTVALASAYSPTSTIQTGITVPCDEHEMYFMLRSKSSRTAKTPHNNSGRTHLHSRSESSLRYHPQPHQHHHHHHQHHHQQQQQQQHIIQTKIYQRHTTNHNNNNNDRHNNNTVRSSSTQAPVSSSPTSSRSRTRPTTSARVSPIGEIIEIVHHHNHDDTHDQEHDEDTSISDSESNSDTTDSTIPRYRGAFVDEEKREQEQHTDDEDDEEDDEEGIVEQEVVAQEGVVEQEKDEDEDEDHEEEHRPLLL